MARTHHFPVGVVVCLAAVLGVLIYVQIYRPHRKAATSLVCIGAMSCDESNLLIAAMRDKGITLGTDGACDLDMTSMMVAPEEKDGAISVAREIQARHPRVYVFLLEDVTVCDVATDYAGVVEGKLKEGGVTLGFVKDDGTIHGISVKRSDRKKALSILEKLKTQHPEYRLELFPQSGL